MAVTAASMRRMGSWGAAAAVAFGLIATAGEAPARAAAPAITEYTANLSAGAGPNVIAPGPSGTMWFSEYDGNRLGRITATGAITEYPTSGPGLTAGAEPSGVVTDGGDIWFTEFGTGEIGELDPSTGRLVGEYPVPAGSGSEPEGIIVGPDGALWFTERAAGQIGRLDPSLATPGTSDGFSEFPIPTEGGHIVPEPVDLVSGAHGTIWVTLINTGIASVVPAGSGVDTTATITRYTLPTPASTSEPEGIAIGPDGDPWVAEYGAGQLARVDPTAVQQDTPNGITEHATAGHPLWLAAGGDGALWATDNVDSELIRFDPSDGTTSTFASAQGVNGDATSDAVDASGDVWFTEFRGDRLGEVTFPSGSTLPPTPPTETLTVTMTGSGTGTVGGSGACAKPTAAVATCQLSFAQGTTVTLTGTPTNGAAFIGWLSVGDSLCVIGSCTVAMTGDEAVTAYFEAPQVLTTQLAGDGQGYVTSGSLLPSSLTKGAVNCVKPPDGPQTCTTSLTYGTELTLTAVPTEGSTFAGWSGACSGLGTCGVNMDNAESVTATFTYDPGVHVNAIEVTQGIQTPELPTRTTAEGYAVSYHGVVLSSAVPSPQIGGGAGVAPVTALLAQGHATVVRVYINTQLSRHGQPAPPMTLRAYRDGKLLAPGPIGADEPPNTSGIPVGALGSVLDSSGQPQRDVSTDAYTFTLPLDWVQGNDITFDATIDPTPFQFPFYCPNTECLDGGIELQGVDFHPVTHVNIDPLAILVNGVGPHGYVSFRPQPDPAWGLVRDVVPFPVNVGPYQGVINASSQVTGCDGVVQGSQTANQFNQSVYAARNGALLALVVKWANRYDTSVDDYPYALVRSGTASTCTGAGSYSGGVSTGGRSLYTSQPQSVSSDDRPLTGIAHELHHGIGLPHAGNLCNSGTIGTAATLTGSTTAGSNTLSLSSTSGLVVGQQITGPGIYAGTEIYAIAGSSVTMTAKASSTNSSQSYTFATGIGQVGSVWPPVFQASSGAMADGLLDGVGLVGLENPANSPYTVRGPAVAGSAGHEIYDLMSYCTGGYDPSSWISVRNWNYDVGFDNPSLISVARRAHRAASSPAATPTPTFSTSPPADPAQPRSLAVMSLYDASTGRTLMTDVEPDAGAPTPASANAEYTLTARNAAGQVIGRAGTVNSLLHVDPSGAEAGASMILVQGKIAAANAHEVDVLQLGKEIGSDHAAAAPPTVTLLGLTAGSKIGGTRGAKLRWRTHAAGGRTVEITIDFSTNGGRSWQAVYEGDDTGSAVLPADLFAASRNARVRIFASDGFSEGVATSPRLVSPGVPPQVTITSPASAIRVPADGVVNLAGTASDGPGHELSGHALVWRAGKQLLGDGAQLTTAALTAGRHMITLTARAAGRSAVASVRVTIVAAQPALTLVHAPARISAKARTVTLRLAADEAARVTIGKHRATIGRSPDAVRLAIKPGKATLKLKVVARSGRYSVTVPITIKR